MFLAFFLLVVHLCFTPCRGRLTFFVLPKKVSKERRARDGDFPLDLCRGEGKEPNSLRSDKAPSFFLPATKIQGAIKGRNVKGHTDGVLASVALIFAVVARFASRCAVGACCHGDRRFGLSLPYAAP
ncbi:hypothetical protein [Ralstonia mannitolilytica]|uniref:hypothetical protein n=1 Tax=Ralstonia mannitolilytica TaxID=105219 RepID=UPI001FC9D33D|nr:hypothetical protein [Ralstonia mannitolilytica]